MKKLLIVLGVLGMCSLSQADPLGDQIKATLLDHIQIGNSFSTDGKNQVTGLDDVFRIGHFLNTYIGSVQAGGYVQTDESGNKKLEGWLVGGNVRIDPFIRKLVVLQPEWTFLNSVNLSVGYYYDATARHGRLMGLTIAVPIGVTPAP